MYKYIIYVHISLTRIFIISFFVSIAVAKMYAKSCPNARIGSLSLGFYRHCQGLISQLQNAFVFIKKKVITSYNEIRGRKCDGSLLLIFWHKTEEARSRQLITFRVNWRSALDTQTVNSHLTKYCSREGEIARFRFAFSDFFTNYFLTNFNDKGKERDWQTRWFSIFVPLFCPFSRRCVFRVIFHVMPYDDRMFGKHRSKASPPPERFPPIFLFCGRADE